MDTKVLTELINKMLEEAEKFSQKRKAKEAKKNILALNKKFQQEIEKK